MRCPERMLGLRQWVTWRVVPDRNGRLTKVPFQTNGQLASSTDAATWTDFDSACKAGDPGFVFAKDGGLFGIDLDGCIGEKGELASWAVPILDAFPSYAEVSPSQHGIKIYCGGNWGRGRQKEMVEAVAGSMKTPKVEVYGSGRYFAYTGQQWEEKQAEIIDCQAAADALLARLWPAPKQVASYAATRIVKGDEIARTLAKCVPATVCGTGSCHNRTFDAACVLVLNFNLPPEQAFSYLSAWAQAGSHLWSEGELWHKLDDANQKTESRGRFLTRESQFATIIDTSPADHLANATNAILLAAEPDSEPDDRPAEVEPVPEGLLRAPGLIDAIMDHTLSTALYPQPELAFTGALCLMSALTGRKVQDANGTRTNVYVLGLAPSGAGKDHARSVNRSLLEAAKAARLLGSEGFASGAGIITELNAAPEPCLLCQVDEFNVLLKSIRSARSTPYLADISKVLLRMFSSSAGTYGGDAYASKDRKVILIQPHLVVHGTAVPIDFWTNLSVEGVRDGLLGRTMIFEGGYVRMNWVRSSPPSESLIDWVSWWANLKTETTGNLGDFKPVPFVVPFSGDAEERLRKHAEEIAERRIGEAVDKAAIWSRTAEKTLKLALLFACSRAVGKTPETVSFEDADRAVRISNWLTRTMLRKVFDHVAENEQEAKVKKVLGILKTEMTMHQFSRKTQWLLRWERDDIISQLMENRQIEVVRQETSGRTRTLLRRIDGSLCAQTSTSHCVK